MKTVDSMLFFFSFLSQIFSKWRLCERDPYQLYQRLEQQAREYVLEMKVRLLRHLSLGSKVASTLATEGPPQAQQFISLLLEEYSALCQAACTISAFLVTLVRLKTLCAPAWLMLTVVSGLFQVSGGVVNCKVLFVFILRDWDSENAV